MIKLTMNEQDFINLMTETAGGSEPDSYSETFTREGLQALFEHFYNLDYDYDFDKISICCDWREYESLDSAMIDYKRALEVYQFNTLDEATTVLECSNGHVVVENF